MKKYDWVLFDFDDTLVNWNAFHGLQLTLSNYGFSLDEEEYQAYQKVNKQLWTEFQDGKLPMHEIQQKRFIKYADQLNIPVHEVADLFHSNMSQVSAPLAGADDLIRSLKQQYKSGIISNGFTNLLQARLQRHQWESYFDVVVISESVGLAKPHKSIFEHTFDLMGKPAVDKILMVGDTFESDILGAINAGIDACWLNSKKLPPPDNLHPKYQIADLTELEKIL